VYACCLINEIEAWPYHLGLFKIMIGPSGLHSPKVGYFVCFVF
jgi:hypothetical protein